MAELLSEQQIADLGTRLRRHGHVKFPLLRTEIDDLAAQAVGELWKFLNDRPAGPALDDDAILRLGYAIFNRRAADLYRKSATQLGGRGDPAPAEDQPDEATADLPKHVLYRRMLAVCAAELATLPEADRTMIALATGLAEGADTAMTPTERQRLSRVRKRLAAAIQRELGDDASRLLRDD